MSLPCPILLRMVNIDPTDSPMKLYAMFDSMMECSFVVVNISEIYLEKTVETASNARGYLNKIKFETKNESFAFTRKTTHLSVKI